MLCYYNINIKIILITIPVTLIKVKMPTLKVS